MENNYANHAMGSVGKWIQLHLSDGNAVDVNCALGYPRNHPIRITEKFKRIEDLRIFPDMPLFKIISWNGLTFGERSVTIAPLDHHFKEAAELTNRDFVQGFLKRD